MNKQEKADGSSLLHSTNLAGPLPLDRGILYRRVLGRSVLLSCVLDGCILERCILERSALYSGVLRRWAHCGISGNVGFLCSA